MGEGERPGSAGKGKKANSEEHVEGGVGRKCGGPVKIGKRKKKVQGKGHGEKGRLKLVWRGQERTIAGMINIGKT